MADVDILRTRPYWIGEFVEEIEANLVRDSELDKFDLQNHFAHLNPQKEE